MARLDAIGIVVADLAATLGFYRLLGLDIPPEHDSDGHVEAVLKGGIRLMFDTEEVVASFDDGFKPSDPPGRINLAFVCNDPASVDATYRAVIDAGHRSHKEPFDAFWGQRYAIVLDPDGNHIDLFAPLGT